jgi:hypothetical protein
MSADTARTLNAAIDDHVRRTFAPAGVTSGRAIKELDEFLGGQAREFGASLDPYHRQLGHAFTQLQMDIRETIARQHPQVAERLHGLNEGFANLIRAEAAGGPAEGGIAGPGQIRQAAVNMAGGPRGARGHRAAGGNALMQDLGDAASTVMRPTIPDSGTPTRALATGLAGAALFGNPTHGIHVNPWAASFLAAIASPYVNRTTGRIARAALTARPAGAEAVRQGIRSAAPVAAIAAGREPARRRN